MRHFVDPLLSNFTDFEISEKKIVSNETNTSRFNIYPKREQDMKITSDDLKQNSQNRVLSIHSKEQDSSDEGFSVVDKECWSKLVDFLASAKFRKEIQVQKSNLRHDIWVDKESSIGTLIVTPY
jgi:hypothetical protein